MTTLYTTLFYTKHLISRTFYYAPGAQDITVPPGAAFVRISGVGAGAWGVSALGNWGGGAAFSRMKTTCTPGETFHLQVGDTAHTLGVVNDSAGDTSCIRATGSVVLMRADRARNSSPYYGQAANSVGDVKRDGAAPLYTGPPTPIGYGQGGDAAGDDADTYPLGFGGRGAMHGGIWQAARGGGGGYQISLPQPTGQTANYAAGNGLLCLEFFDQDPGY
jgi:hypothetical protein